MTWNPEQEEATESMSLVEKGAYLCLVSDAEVAMKDINTRGVKLTLQILHPNATTMTKYDGRKVFLYYTWDNKNAMAVKLGRQGLADLLFALDVKGKQFNTPDDVCDAVINGEVIANVIQRKRTDTGDIQNNVQMFFRKDGTHRGAKQTFRVLDWGGVESGLGSGRSNGGASATADDGDVPF